jgi:hypothetical protein
MNLVRQAGHLVKLATEIVGRLEFSTQQTIAHRGEVARKPLGTRELAKTGSVLNVNV